METNSARCSSRLLCQACSEFKHQRPVAVNPRRNIYMGKEVELFHDWCQTTTVHRKEPSRHIILHRLSWCNRSQLSHVLITCQCPYTCAMLLYSQLHHSYLSIVLGSYLACLFQRKCYTTHIPKKTRWSVCDKLIWTFSNYLNLTEKLLNNEARQTKREARETPPFSIQ